MIDQTLYSIHVAQGSDNNERPQVYVYFEPAPP
jgi:hypothetical protein